MCKEKPQIVANSYLLFLVLIDCNFSLSEAIPAWVWVNIKHILELKSKFTHSAIVCVFPYPAGAIIAL